MHGPWTHGLMGSQAHCPPCAHGHGALDASIKQTVEMQQRMATSFCTDWLTSSILQNDECEHTLPTHPTLRALC